MQFCLLPSCWADVRDFFVALQCRSLRLRLQQRYVVRTIHCCCVSSKSAARFPRKVVVRPANKEGFDAFVQASLVADTLQYELVNFMIITMMSLTSAQWGDDEPYSLR